MALGKRIELLKEKQMMQPIETNNVLPQNSQSNIASNSNKDIMFTLFQPEAPKYSFDDVILNSNTYDAIQDALILYEKRELLFEKWGLGNTYKKQNCIGINLYGPSGTGKSITAHAIANQVGRNILTVDYSQIESKYVGETSKNLVAMFEYAKASNAIIFFDEADALLSKRVTNMSNSTDVSVNQTRSVLLVLINEFNDLILFATNFITNYDPAFIRRILAHIKFELPDEDNRFKLWRMYIPSCMPTNVDIKRLAARYSEISGSDIANAVLSASLRAARLDDDKVYHVYFEEAIERIIESKADNDSANQFTSRRIVSEDYVKSQFGGRLPE